MRVALLLTVLSSVLAAPAPLLSSLYAKPAAGRTAVSPADQRELARLAKSVNAAYCPHSRATRLEPSSQLRLGAREQGTVLASSLDGDFETEDAPDMSWYISHTPSTGVLTVSFSSVSSADDLLSSLSAEQGGIPSVLPLPTYIFQALGEPDAPRPRVHMAYLPALESHGTAVIATVLDLLDAPPLPVVKKSVFESTPANSRSFSKIEITGHGLGAATALLVSAALRLELANRESAPALDATLFSLPRVGDSTFSSWLDTLTSETFTLRRVTSYADAIPHVPVRTTGLTHPRAVTEIFVGANPRDISICGPTEGELESAICANAVKADKHNLLDQAGPYAGVWIRGECA